MENIREIASVVFKALTLAMGVAVVVLSKLGNLDVQTAVSLLGIGLACAGIALLSKQYGSDRENPPVWACCSCFWWTVFSAPCFGHRLHIRMICVWVLYKTEKRIIPA